MARYWLPHGSSAGQSYSRAVKSRGIVLWTDTFAGVRPRLSVLQASTQFFCRVDEPLVEGHVEHTIVLPTI